MRVVFDTKSARNLQCKISKVDFHTNAVAFARNDDLLGELKIPSLKKVATPIKTPLTCGGGFASANARNPLGEGR
ncbi:hypothetical protein [Helicobacter sp. T3_23-1056]